MIKMLNYYNIRDRNLRGLSYINASSAQMALMGFMCDELDSAKLMNYMEPHAMLEDEDWDYKVKDITENEVYFFALRINHHPNKRWESLEDEWE